MTTINNNTLDDEEIWGFYVDIENIVVNKIDIQKNNKFHLTLEDISEEYEYYSSQESISENILYKNYKNEPRIHICNVIYNSVITLLLFYFIFCVI
jgi:hypothetical protein